MIQPLEIVALARAAHDDRLAAATKLAALLPANTAPTPPTDRGVDLRDYLAVHGMVRRATRALRDATAPGRVLDDEARAALHRYWAGYAAELHMHHTVEDTIFFPALAERDPATATELARIDADHAALDDLIAEGHAAFADVEATGEPARAHHVLVRLERLLTDHLDFEDDVLLPRIAARFTHAEYDAMQQRAVKMPMPLRQVAFLVGFVATWIDPDAWQRLWDTAPLAMRLAYRLTRRHHARLVRAALGRGPTPGHDDAA